MTDIAVIVRLNGTDCNPYKKWGLQSNPFPALAKADPRFTVLNRALADLGSNPIVDMAELRDRLDGYGADEGFIDLCCQQYQPGRMVAFHVTFPDGVRTCGCETHRGMTPDQFDASTEDCQPF